MLYLPAPRYFPVPPLLPRDESEGAHRCIFQLFEGGTPYRSMVSGNNAITPLDAASRSLHGISCVLSILFIGIG